ncbi:YIP1 family protein [Streptomyces sp. XD-27]|uniref:YIP1 family protein n=1 Tax=Streptomyces sp. XD-27 TaxID=3062779 RepID=UPI0026F47830|nr:YIP1 family protein [Streptomyces sp. XD-27]WKX74310.1 YIP1 family protein [Streptomyces sp. XD-27]
MVAGFRMGRGRDSRSTQQGPQGQPGHYPGQQPPRAPYGQQTPPGAPYGGPQAPRGGAPYGGGGQAPYGGAPQAPRGGQAPYGRQQGGPRPPYGGQPQWSPQDDGPEYFDGQDGQDPYRDGHDPYRAHGAPGGHPGGDPGQTQQFSLGEAPDYDPYGRQDPGPGYAPDPYGDDYGTGGPAGPPPGPRLHWKDLLRGIVLRPADTFWRMRDHAMWGPALIVTFVYGLLAVFGFDKAREDVLNASMSNSIPAMACTGVAMVLGGLVLGAVTHTLARQLGGDGMWAPTIGLSMLIMSVTDAPRLLFAMFLGGDSLFVQALGWATWVAAGALFTSMVSKSHDLPWPKALGASSIQLIGLLSLLKLGTL